MEKQSLEYIPTYLERYVKEFRQTEEGSELTLRSSAGNDRLEVWYAGDLRTFEGEEQPYVVEADRGPERIVAKDPETGEEILLHDGARYGYDNLFCEAYDEETVRARVLKRYPIQPAEILVSIGYGIDYEQEREDYEIDERGNVELFDGSKIPWDEAKRNGMDFLSLAFRGPDGEWVEFYEKELA